MINFYNTYTKEDIEILKDITRHIIIIDIVPSRYIEEYELYNLFSYFENYSDGKRVHRNLSLNSDELDALFGNVTELEQRTQDYNMGKNIIFFTPLEDIPLYINNFPNIVKWRLQINK